MEQIRKADGGYYYGTTFCRTADEVYELFRGDYHASLGKKSYRRLNRLGQRKERLHGFGFEFADGTWPQGERFKALGRVRYYILGLVGISYWRTVGLWDSPKFNDEDEYWEWFHWAFSRGSGGARLVGLRQKHGRTSKILKKKHYRTKR